MYACRFRGTILSKDNIVKEKKAIKEIRAYCKGDAEALKLIASLIHAYRLRGSFYYASNDPLLEPVQQIEKSLTVSLTRHFEKIAKGAS
jgi:hypothetical protein